MLFATVKSPVIHHPFLQVVVYSFYFKSDHNSFLYERLRSIVIAGRCTCGVSKILQAYLGFPRSRVTPGSL